MSIMQIVFFNRTVQFKVITFSKILLFLSALLHLLYLINTSQPSMVLIGVAVSQLSEKFPASKVCIKIKTSLFCSSLFSVSLRPLYCDSFMFEQPIV